MEDNPPKVNKWDGTAIKNALDDAVSDLNYVESHWLLDGRLIISSFAVAFSLYAILWDFLHPFPKSRSVMLVCVLVYFMMMGVLTVYTTYIERGIFCTYLDKDPAGIEPATKWSAVSTLKRFDSVYHLSLEMKSGQSGKMIEAGLALPVNKYFDEEGNLVYSKISAEVNRLHSDLKKKNN